MQDGSTKPKIQEAFLEEETHEPSLKGYKQLARGVGGAVASREGQKPVQRLRDGRRGVNLGYLCYCALAAMI